MTKICINYIILQVDGQTDTQAVVTNNDKGDNNLYKYDCFGTDSKEYLRCGISIKNVFTVIPLAWCYYSDDFLMLVC